ncbi:MAG: hypothetical protein DRN37_10545 [Thermoplasmata archaeon]|nr:MAG: hypothetical protein B6U90_06165 [Thermoplasmatales archaeon ex4484_6]RLF54189.1 MAG: hypothetical protein DRN37_10545 [Thermoplasmata archaeon]
MTDLFISIGPVSSVMRGKTGTGLVLLVVSSILLLISGAILLSGVLHSQQVVFTERDLVPSNSPSTFEKSFDVKLFSTLTYTISDREERIHFKLEIEGPDGEVVHKKRGSGEETGSVQLRGSGRYTLILEFDEADASPDDVDLEIRLSGPVLLGTCCVSGLLGVVYITALLAGMTYLLVGYLEERRRYVR